jgi:hypothetical protein
MSTRLRRHPLRTIDGIEEKFCPGCDDFLPVERFSRRRQGSHREGELLSRCKSCIASAKVKHGDQTGWIDSRISWPIFDELVMRLGLHQASQSISMSENAYRDLLYKRTFFTQKRFVRRAIVLLRELRDENVWERPTQGRPLAHRPYCRGCGADLSSNTLGCRVCTWRHYERKKRRGFKT